MRSAYVARVTSKVRFFGISIRNLKSATPVLRGNLLQIKIVLEDSEQVIIDTP